MSVAISEDGGGGEDQLVIVRDRCFWPMECTCMRESFPPFRTRRFGSIGGKLDSWVSRSSLRERKFKPMCQSSEWKPYRPHSSCPDLTQWGPSSNQSSTKSQNYFELRLCWRTETLKIWEFLFMKDQSFGEIRSEQDRLGRFIGIQLKKNDKKADYYSAYYLFNFYNFAIIFCNEICHRWIVLSKSGWFIIIWWDLIQIK